MQHPTFATIPPRTRLLRIEDDGTPVVACDDCGRDYAVNYRDRPCPACQAEAMKLDDRPRGDAA